MTPNPDTGNQLATWRNGERSGLAADLNRFFASSAADMARNLALFRITEGRPTRDDVMRIAEALTLWIDPERCKSASSRRAAARLLSRLHWANGCGAETPTLMDEAEAADAAKPAARPSGTARAALDTLANAACSAREGVAFGMFAGVELRAVWSTHPDARPPVSFAARWTSYGDWSAQGEDRDALAAKLARRV